MKFSRIVSVPDNLSKGTNAAKLHLIGLPDERLIIGRSPDHAQLLIDFTLENDTGYFGFVPVLAHFNGERIVFDRGGQEEQNAVYECLAAYAMHLFLAIKASQQEEKRLDALDAFLGQFAGNPLITVGRFR